MLKTALQYFSATLVLFAALIFVACGQQPSSDSPSPQQTTEISQPAEEDSTTYFTQFNIPTEITLLNNSSNYQFECNYSPSNANADIQVSFSQNSIVQLCENNILKPLNVGQTTITIKVPISKTEFITKTCLVIVEEDDTEFSLNITDFNGQAVSCFKSGQKADSSYEIYTATLTSERQLEGFDFEIIKTNNVNIESGSKKLLNGNYVFNFYLTSGGEFSLKVRTDERAINTESQIIESNLIKYNSTSFFSALSAQLSGVNKNNIQTENGKYVLYAVKSDYVGETKAQHPTNAQFEILCELNAITAYSVESSNTSILEVDNGIIKAKSVGDASITFTATDGSGQNKTINFIIKNVPIHGVNVNIENLQNVNVYLTNEYGYPVSFCVLCEAMPAYSTANFELVTESDCITISGLEITSKSVGVATVILKLNGESYLTFYVNVSVAARAIKLSVNQVGSANNISLSGHTVELDLSKTNRNISLCFERFENGVKQSTTLFSDNLAENSFVYYKNWTGKNLLIMLNNELSTPTSFSFNVSNGENENKIDILVTINLVLK